VVYQYEAPVAFQEMFGHFFQIEILLPGLSGKLGLFDHLIDSREAEVDEVVGAGWVVRVF